MEAFILKCRPFNPIHLGKSSLETSEKVIHSDTLYAALVNNYVKLFGEEGLLEFHEAFCRGELLISSAFPCLENEKEELVYLLPRPENYLNSGIVKINGLDHKSLKKADFISSDLWKNAQQEGLSPPDAIGLGSGILLSPEEATRLGLDQINRPYNKVEPIGSSSRPKVHARKPGDENAYFVLTTTDPQRVKLSESSWVQTHYYFLLDSKLNKKDTVHQRLHACIAMLPDQGIGGERNAGCGSFLEVEMLENWDLFSEKAASPEAYVGVSLAIPESLTAFRTCNFYQLMTRGGNAIRSQDKDGEAGYPGFERMQIRMLKEGAVFNSEKCAGNIVDLRIDPTIGHPIWRNGMLFTLPI